MEIDLRMKRKEKSMKCTEAAWRKILEHKNNLICIISDCKRENNYEVMEQVNSVQGNQMEENKSK